LKKSQTSIKVKKTEKFQFNKNYGLYANRPFRVVTKMRSGRVLTAIKNNV
jgi:hypothetical protein